MRKFLILLFLGGAISLFANPIIPRIVQQFWFNDAGDMMLQVGYEASHLMTDSLFISDGTNSMVFAYDFPSDAAAYPITFNLSYLMPDLLDTPECGYLQVKVDDFWYDEVSWGSSGIEDQLPIIATQSIYQTKIYDSFSWETLDLWAKSDHPDNVQNYSSTTSSIITIYIHYQDGSPAANIPVFHAGLYYPLDYSDETGLVELELPCAWTHLRIYEPGTEELVFAEDVITEPAGCYVYNVSLQATAIQDEVQQTPSAAIKIYPNVLKPGQKLHIIHDKKTAAPTRIRLLDLKGRVLQETDYEEDWPIPKLASGVYFLQILQDGKVLSKHRIIILK